jgi:outer membrane protein assembly factor BamB
MMYSSGASIADGKLISGGYGGQVFAYDLADGKLLWTANADNEGLESAYERTPLTVQVVDGKVYARSQEHSHTQPLYRSWKVWCFDLETGNRIWELNGYWSEFAFSDGIGVSLNGMDNQVYAIGKGPSALTINIQDDTVTSADGVLVTGKVTDISAGTKSSDLMARFPDGVPVVSDESQTDMMQYVYMNMPKPTNSTGITVNFDVMDANGNFRPIGTTTTDANGFYSFNWTPDIEGKYTITASFQGTHSYWPSDAQTAFLVNAPAPTASPQPTLTLPPTEMYVLGIGVAIIIAIAIVGALILMAVRKRA